MMQHGAMAIVGQQALVPSLFAAGLAGSAMHCAGMCGPYVVAQSLVAQDGSTTQKLRRIAGGALLPYHAGRMTTYVFLGVMASFISGQFKTLPWFQDLAAVLLVMAGISFLFSALSMEGLKLPPLLLGVVEIGMRRVEKCPRFARQYFRGVLLGFIPCGLVYAAMLAAAASGDPLQAVAGMAAFTLGTVPLLVAAGLAGRMLSVQWRHAALGMSRPLMVFNSLCLFYLAGALIQ